MHADPDVLLNKHDLKSLVRILRGAAHLYNELAIHLGMDADWVKNVESNTPTVQKRLIEVLSHFIGNDEHPTRRKIADALRDVDQRGLALEILGGTYGIVVTLLLVLCLLLMIRHVVVNCSLRIYFCR